MFRYAIRPHKGFAADDAARFGVACSQPLIVVPASGPAAPASRASQLSSDKVVITAFKPSDDGKAWIVRLFGASGKTEKVKLCLGQPRPAAVVAQRHQRTAPAKGRLKRRSPWLGHCHIAGGVSGRRGSLKEARSAWASPARSTTSNIRSGVTTPHPQPKDRRMRKAAETPCKQRAFHDPPRTPAGPLPDPFPSNTPATRAAPATTNLQERREHPPSKRLGPFRDCTLGQGLPSPPSAVLLQRTGPPSAVPVHPPHSRYGGLATKDGSTRQRCRRVCSPARPLQPRPCPRAWAGGVAMKMKQRGSEKGGDHSLVHFLLRGNGPTYGRTPIRRQRERGEQSQALFCLQCCQSTV